jgi:DNA-binding CsgD family transcriptional regulator
MFVGRAQQRSALTDFLQDVRTGPTALVLEGEPGIGKSVLWSHGVGAARDAGYRILSCRPTGPDAELSFVALADLLAVVDDSVLEELPGPQREALEVALLRRRRTGRAQDPRAAAAGTLAVLIAMSSEGPALVAIDDVQWIDSATQRVLTFAVRRLEHERVGFLLGRPTTGDRPPLGLADALPADRVRFVDVGPLSAAEIGVIVKERVGLSLTKPDIARITELAGGNPFYAIEIARARARGDKGVTGQRLPIPKSLRDDLVRGRIGTVSPETRDLLLLAASTPRPTIDALERVVSSPALQKGLQQAIDAGLVEVLGLDLHFVHPLYRSAIYADGSRRRRHKLHRRLAETSTDPEERARHLALAADGPDAGIADDVEQAAASARAKGAPEVAAELLEHAVRLTPRDDAASSRRRMLLAVSDRMATGDLEGAHVRAQEALRISVPGADQVEPLRLIGAIEFARGSLAEARAILDEALVLAGDDTRTSAEIHEELARVAIRASEVGSAERSIGTARKLASLTDDASLARSIETTLTELDLLLARPARALHETDSDAATQRSELIAAQADAFAGRVDAARERLERLLLFARESGDEPGVLLVTIRLAELAIRSGQWPEAEALTGEAHALSVDLGMSERLPLALMAFAFAGRGDAERARAVAENALTAGGDRTVQLWSHAALGFLELSLARFPEALRHLGRAGGLLAETGIADPCAFPFLFDEIEALVGVGDHETASLRIDSLSEMGERLDRDLVRGQAERGRGLKLSAEGDIGGSLAALEHAVKLHERVGIGMEVGRSLLALGATRRRDRQKRPAREALGRALELFTAAGASAWMARAQEELARIGGRRASVGELTEAEIRVASLAASGMTNREIARTLSMSVRTVEGHLSHVYAKLEVRSRTELALFFERES